MDQSTHTVSNQVDDLVDYNLYTSDAALQEAVQRGGGAAYHGVLGAYGQQVGSAASFAMAQDANRHRPELRSFDRQGRRTDSVHFHPAWHKFLAMGYTQGLHCSAWSQPGPGAHLARAAAFLMHGQVEAGSLCPLTMTAASIPLLQHQDWFSSISDKLFSRRYDARDIHWSHKTSMMVGMGMTEKQGGSDLRTNTTRAVPLAGDGPGRSYLLTRVINGFFRCPCRTLIWCLPVTIVRFPVSMYRAGWTKNGAITCTSNA